MKRCPVCRRDYTDETLNYCLDDGTALVAGAASINEQQTAILTESPSEARTRSDIGDQSARESKPSKNIFQAVGPGSWLTYGVVILILAVGGYLAYRYFGSSATPASKPIDSVAVLPFLNKSGNPDSEYLSEGLSESLVYRLSQLPDLRVSPPSTVMHYQGQDVDPVGAGNELGVSAVVRGKIVERDGNLTISAELIDVRQNKLIWGEQYDRKMSDLLATQREIAREIVSNLKLKVSGNETGLAKHYTENNEAYKLYLRARYHWTKRTVEGSKKTIEYLGEAIEKDPGFALAYAGLADAYSVPNTAMAPAVAMPKAKAAALRALELDDSLAEGHTSLARVLSAYDWDWAGAEREFKRAIDLNPRYPVAHEWYGLYLAALGETEASVAERKLALELEPLSPIVNFEFGQSLYWLRDYPAAIEQFQKTLELDPNLPATYYYLGAAYEFTGRSDEALNTYQKVPSTTGIEWGGAMSGLIRVYVSMNRKDEARKILAQLERAQKDNYVSAPVIANGYASLGNKDRAFAWLDQAYKDRAFQLQQLKVDPRWDSLRSDPRFADLVRRMGLPQ